MIRRLLLTLACLLAGNAGAATIVWGTGIGDQLHTSTGTVLDGTFVFELGTFTTGFVPSENNTSDWASNWKVFDRAPAGDGWDPATHYVSSTATLQADGTSDSVYASASTTFAAGEQAYIWAFNDKSGVQGSEWALVTGSFVGSASNTTWKMPIPGDQTSAPLEWRLDNASAIMLGGLNDTRGPGEFTAEPPAYELQTSAIPEPSAGMLIGAVGALVALQRRRKGAKA